MNLNEKLSKFINSWTQATKEQFTGHPIANLFRQDLRDEIEQLVKQNLILLRLKPVLVLVIGQIYLGAPLITQNFTQFS